MPAQKNGQVRQEGALPGDSEHLPGGVQKLPDGQRLEAVLGEGGPGRQGEGDGGISVFRAGRNGNQTQPLRVFLHLGTVSVEAGGGIGRKTDQKGDRHQEGDQEVLPIRLAGKVLNHESGRGHRRF